MKKLVLKQSRGVLPARDLKWEVFSSPAQSVTGRDLNMSRGLGQDCTLEIRT